MKTQPTCLALFTIVGTALVAPSAWAQSAGSDQVAAARSAGNSLKEQPAVRHRLLLVNGRFEVTPTFEATINADYNHTISGGLKVEYHLSDMLSVGAVGAFGVSLNTGLVDSIVVTLPDAPIEDDPTPSKQQYLQHLNEMPLHGAAYVSITPWYGKLAAFGTAFVNFDFYFSGGLAYAQLANSCDASICNDPTPGEETTQGEGENQVVIPPDLNPNNDPPLNDGDRFGLYLGGGIHVFLNNWMALDLTVRNYIFDDNPSGLDYDYDFAVQDTDSRFLSHLFMGVGVSMFFPFTPERTP